MQQYIVPISQKHHYIPQFYLKQWAGDDRKICEFSRPFKSVIARRKYPSATGYETNLYTISTLPVGLSQAVEEKFMKKTDQLASDALRLLLDDNLVGLNNDMKSAWARFIMSLIYRHPESMKWIKGQVEQHRAKLRRDFESQEAHHHLEPMRSIFPKSVTQSMKCWLPNSCR
jgi:hypothetical protein